MVKTPPKIESLEDYEHIFGIFYTIKEELEQKGVKVDYVKPLNIKSKNNFVVEIFSLANALSSALEQTQNENFSCNLTERLKDQGI